MPGGEMPGSSPAGLPKPNGSESRAPVGSSYDWSYFKAGAKNLVSIPALILMSVFVGYGGISREAGLTLGQAAFSVPTIWAFPSHLLLVSGIASGASLLATFIAVTLASIRMMPMTMALMPEIRAPHSRWWHLLLVSNFVAITAWVHTLQKAPELPPRGRLPYFAGFAITLALTCTLITAITHLLAAGFPPLVRAGLYFLTPLYFAISIWRTARVRGEYIALFAGFALCPAMTILAPGSEILVSGIVGGAIGYTWHLVATMRGRA